MLFIPFIAGYFAYNSCVQMMLYPVVMAGALAKYNSK